MTGNSQDLVRSAVFLREQAPNQWENFCRSLATYAASVAHDFVRADPSLLMRAQGMALMAEEIAAICLKAPELFDKQRRAELEAQQAKMRKPDARAGSWTG